METSIKNELVTPRLMHKRYNSLKSIGSCEGGGTQMLKQIIESVLREDTTEQLDSAFEGITRAISLRSAQGLGTDEGLKNEMLAAITAERNTRPPVAEP
jgi:alpha-galactosidase/6-phospho-beta-glucosidase family protein